MHWQLKLDVFCFFFHWKHFDDNKATLIAFQMDYALRQPSFITARSNDQQRTLDDSREKNERRKKKKNRRLNAHRNCRHLARTVGHTKDRCVIV